MPTDTSSQHVGVAAGGSDCIDDYELFRYYTKAVTGAEAERIEQHLVTCEICSGILVALAKDASTPMSADQKEEVSRLLTSSPEAQVGRILQYVNPDANGEKKIKVEVPPPVAISARPPLEQQPPWSKVPLELLNEESKLKSGQAGSEPSYPLEQQRRMIPLELLSKISRPPLRRYALALSILIAVLAVFPIYQMAIREDVDAQYVFDDRIPYDYDISGLRGSSSALPQDSLFQVFLTQFRLGLADYLIRDYAAAVTTFQSSAPTAQALQSQPDHEKILPWLRDFYFYLGVSHFALSRSRVGDLSSEVKQQHAAESIRWLALADSLVAVRNLESSDRESYFLGLAYGFGGRRDLAVAQLRKIAPVSRFYEDSAKLINEWSK
jgi:hypothetical protein